MLAQLLQSVEDQANARQPEILRAVGLRLQVPDPCLSAHLLVALQDLDRRVIAGHQAAHDWWNDLDPATSDMLEMELPYVRAYDVDYKAIKQRLRELVQEHQMMFWKWGQSVGCGACEVCLENPKGHLCAIHCAPPPRAIDTFIGHHTAPMGFDI